MSEGGFERLPVPGQQTLQQQVHRAEQQEGAHLAALVKALLPPQQVETDQGGEGHRNEQRGGKGESDYDRERGNEGPLVARQQEEGEKGDDVDQGAEDHRVTQMVGTQPGGAQAGLALVQGAIDAIGRHHRHIDQHAQGDDERGNGNLVQRNMQQMHPHEGHRHRQRDGGGHDQRLNPFALWTAWLCWALWSKRPRTNPSGTARPQRQ